MNVVERIHTKHNVPALLQEHDAKFAEIKTHLAKNMFGPDAELATLTPSQLDRVEARAVRAHEEWDERDVDDVDGKAPATPLQHLLAQRLEIEGRLLDAIDEADDELRELEAEDSLSAEDAGAISDHLHEDHDADDQRMPQ